MSVVIATIVVVVLLAASDAHLFHGELEPKQQFDEVVFDTPSWCDDSLIATPPTVEEVVKEVAVLVGRLSVAVVAFFLVDTVVRCLCCLAVGAVTLKDDEVEVADVVCCTDGVEALTPDDVVVAVVACRTDGIETLTPDDVVVAGVVCRTDLVADVAEVVVDLSCHSCCNSVDDQC